MLILALNDHALGRIPYRRYIRGNVRLLFLFADWLKSYIHADDGR